MKKFISIAMSIALLVLVFAGCSSDGSSSGNSSSSDSAATSQNGETSQTSEASQTEETSSSKSGEERSVGFVTFGLGGDFFQQLADAYVAKMTSLGWKADYADGKFDPTAQIEACENYISMKVDVLVIWSVAPEAMTSVIDQAMAAGIKVVSFVAPTEKYDVLLVADNAELAESCAMLAAKWIDKKYESAEDRSVPVAVFTDRTADTGVMQGDVLLKIEDYSKKAKFIKEVECSAEDVPTGLSKAENLYTSNPETKVFLSAHNGLALGINNYFTSINSPVSDYSDMGIFTINGDEAIANLIKSSASDESLLRGMVLTGSVDETAKELSDMILGIMDGSVSSGHIQKANTTFVNVDTVDEYLSTGKVESVSKDDFK